MLCGDGENLSGGGIHFYQSGEKATPEAHQLFCDLIRERDEVVQYAHARPVPPAPVESYDRGFLASSIIAGDRRVYRITPNRSTETNVLQSADALEFVNAMEKMMITGGRLHERSQSTIAPLGWLVIGPVDS